MSDELAHISSLLDRFDRAITQLSEVSNSMDKMLAVHESRLENQEKQAEIIHSRINDFKKEMMDGIKDLRYENKIQHAEVNERLARLEKWRWFVVGAAACFGFIFAQMSAITKIFN